MKRPHLLITRPQASADSFVARLSHDIQAQSSVLVSPLMKIVPAGEKPNLLGYSGVIFTSVNAVECAPMGNGRSAHCVGGTTTKIAIAAGWKVLSTAINADGLIDNIINAGATGPFIHLAGRHRRGEIAEKLSIQGTHVDVHTLYDQQLLPLSEEAQSFLNGEARVVVPLFSPRTAKHFIEQAQRLDRVTVIAISDAVASLCKGVHAIQIAEAPTREEMIRSVEKALCDITLA